MHDKWQMARQTYDHLFKILLIGDSGVGKTSIQCLFSEVSLNASYASTIGFDSKAKTIEVNQKKIRLQIWLVARRAIFRPNIRGLNSLNLNACFVI